jgi:hypothetical protein
MSCMEVWGGSQLTERGVAFGGLDAWVYSKPYGQARRGGDVYYASSCATGRITRLLLADVAGHGTSVAATAADLRLLMRRFVNCLDQTELVRSRKYWWGGYSRSQPTLACRQRGAAFVISIVDAELALRRPVVPCSRYRRHAARMRYLFTLCAGTIPGVFNWIV